LPEAIAKFAEKLLLSAREAAELCGIGRSTWLRLHSSERCLLSIRLGTDKREQIA